MITNNIAFLAFVSDESSGLLFTYRKVGGITLSLIHRFKNYIFLIICTSFLDKFRLRLNFCLVKAFAKISVLL